MELTLVRSRAAELETDVVVLREFEGAPRPELAKLLAASYSSGEITGKLLEFTLLHGLDGYNARRVLIAGAGKREKFETAALRKIAGAAIRFLKGKGTTSVAFSLDEATPARIEAIAEAATLAAWEPDYLKTDKEGKNKAISSVSISVSSDDPALGAALEKAWVVGEAANLTRDIAVEPPNLLTPLTLAERARRMAEANGLAIEALDQDPMRQLRMGALLC